MSKLFLVFCLLALAYTQGDFNQQFASTDPVADKSTSKIDIMFNFMDAPLVDIVWCGAKKNVVFILTEKNTLYRSVDDGFTGQRLTEHLQKLGRQELNGGSEIEVGQVSRIIQSPTEKSMLIVQGTGNVNWITEDCGAGFRAMDQGRPVLEFLFHPTERNWLLATAWTKCEDFVGEPCLKYKELYVSKNLGGSWDLIASYVFQFSWARVDSAFYRIPRERVIIAYEPNGKDHQKITGGWNDKIEVGYSDDFFKTNTTLVKGGDKFLITSFFIFVVKVNKEDAQEVTLLVGDSRLKNYTLRPIELPVKRLLEHSYTILDTAEHSVFLHINHDGETSTYGNIYVSDSTGVRYSSTLTGNVRNADGQCDFERVQGLEGIYLANIYDKDARKRFKNVDFDTFPQQRQGAKKTSDVSSAETFAMAEMYGADAAKRSLDDFKRTFISFDKGGIWQPLMAPERDSKGTRIPCNPDEDCYLHLHSISNTNFGPFYSTENSLGMIIGTGNIGRYLSNHPDEINTYLSRDGGLTWVELAKGSHIYEIGDHGSIIVMAPDQYATTEVYYSWNEGLTWETLKISDVPVEVENIIIEPTNTAEKFIIYGRETETTKRGIVVAADFTPLHQRTCTGVETPDDPKSDYETWTPNGKISPHCLLGRQVTYTRRKRDAECFNKEDHDRWRFVHKCECTEEDWECDYGYVRIGSGPCLPIDEKEALKNAYPPDVCEDFYHVTQGYRKIGGDQCEGGISHDPIKIPCPRSISARSQNMIALTALSVAVIILIWKTGKSTLDKLKGIPNALKGLVKRAPKGQAKGSQDGFHSFDQVSDSLRDEEDDFGRVTFEESEEKAEPITEENLLEVAQGKKMTERRAIATASKHVPVLSKPGEKKGPVSRNLLEY